MWRIKTENRCVAFPTKKKDFSTGVRSRVGRVPEIKYSFIALLQRKNTCRHTYQQPSGVKFSLCLVRVLYSGGDNDSTHAAAFLSSGFRLTAVGFLSFNKNILVSTLQLLQQRPSERRKQFPKSKFD